MSTATNSSAVPHEELPEGKRKLLFWACWISLVATSFGFVVRTMIIDNLGAQFNLTQTQKGEILGVGLWPFAISIILFSLVIDKIGYGRAMVFAFVCHVLSAILTITATGYQQLYWATFIVALANGTVEAVINPVVATLFPREKTKWLNILHAGWPGGLVLGGLLALLMGPETNWKYKVALILIPTVIYGILMLGCKFPIHERVAAGVPYREMLREFGVIGALIVSLLIFKEIGRVFAFPDMLTYGIVIALTLLFGALTGFSPGRGLFIILVLIMIPLATAELGTDSWITPLMEPEMKNLGLQAGWVLVYTSFIMMVLRFCAGPIVHRISPLGLLAVASAIAVAGLLFLSTATGVMILVAATIYALGKTFFWPTMLGVVSEQFPRGGALTMNGIAGVGMLGVGIVGAIFLGYIQDTSVASRLQKEMPAVYQRVTTEKPWTFGKYVAVNPEMVKGLPPAESQEIERLSNEAKKSALSTVAIFPGIMLVSYLLLIAWFKTRGGYKPVVLSDQPETDASGTGAEPAATT